MTSATGVQRGDGNEPGPLRVGGRPQADRQPEPPLLGREAVDLGDEPDRADRDRLGRDRAAEGAAEQVGGRHHAVVIQERLAHPHEDGPGDPPALRDRTISRA